MILATFLAYVRYRSVPVVPTDENWVTDLGYEESELHKLWFQRPGDRSTPDILIEIGKRTLKMGFDTGCGSGIAFTDAVEGKMGYKVLGTAGAFNRDGSHRGWTKTISIDEFSVFGQKYEDVVSSISDWTMFSATKFNGMIGLAFFQEKVVTLDYAGGRIAVSATPVNYERLDRREYVVLPLYHSTSPGQETLPFFEAEYEGAPAMIYLDTGKNYSYVYDKRSERSDMEKPDDFCNTSVKIGGMEITLIDVVRINSLAQAEGLPFPTIIEMNSDQIWKNDLLVTLDLIEQKIIFRHQVRGRV